MQKKILSILFIGAFILIIFFSLKKNLTEEPSTNITPNKTIDSQNTTNLSTINVNQSNTNESHPFNIESEYAKEYNKLTKEERQIEDLNRKKAAVLNYSRSGNNSDTEDFLRNALKEGTLNESEYQGELGHMLSIEVKNPEEILNTIIESGDKYGYEVALGSIASNPAWIRKISNDERKSIVNDIYSNKPKISGHVMDLGFSDVFTYQNWLRSISSLSSNEDEFYNSLSHLILNELTDPRESIAIEYTLSDFSTRDLLSNNAKEKLKYDINNYINSYPENQVANHIVVERNQDR